MRVALVHDWLTSMRGGEKVLAAIANLFPEADLFTLLHAKGTCQPIVSGRRVVCSWLNRLPQIRRYYRYCLGLMPYAIESLKVADYDLILSTSHCVAKGVLSGDKKHICYCHSPMRYIWGMQTSYQTTMRQTLTGRLSHGALAMLTPQLQKWDVKSSRGIDAFIANSQTVAQRIKHLYSRDSKVVYPPVDTEFYYPDPNIQSAGFYLVVGAMAPYKRVDQAVEAFSKRTDLQLVIIGTGQMEQALRAKATDNVRFLGWADNLTIRDHYRRCKALLFPGEEDFGITPVEAMACGAPVIAYDSGGATETVIAKEGLGVRYPAQTVDAVLEGIETLESWPEVDSDALVNNAQAFSYSAFRKAYTAVLREEGIPID